MTTTKVEMNMTRTEYVKKLRAQYEKNKHTLLDNTEVTNNMMELFELKKQNAEDLEDHMGILGITIKTIDNTFSKNQEGRFTLDEDDLATMMGQINEPDFMNMDLCNFHFQKGKTIAINIAREAKEKYLEMLNEVETPADMYRFMVEFEEEKLKYIELFHEQAGHQFDLADEYCKFNWGNLVLMEYNAQRKLLQPKLHQFKGLSAFIDTENEKIIYKIFFDKTFKVIKVTGEIDL
ncbi:hypothetical protein [Peribacillus simplex]|uniref:hypothetical protein n=1 Tax=Peribacillus simplex TaxID=1478 RepID=UPI003D2B3606